MSGCCVIHTYDHFFLGSVHFFTTIHHHTWQRPVQRLCEYVKLRVNEIVWKGDWVSEWVREWASERAKLWVSVRGNAYLGSLRSRGLNRRIDPLALPSPTSRHRSQYLVEKGRKKNEERKRRKEGREEGKKYERVRQFGLNRVQLGLGIWSGLGWEWH